MEDVISVSSGSEEDSDIEVIGSYCDDKEDAIPFIRAPFFTVKPVFINITSHRWARPRRKCPRSPSSPIEVVDLSDDSHPDNSEQQTPTPELLLSENENQTLGSPVTIIPENCRDTQRSNAQDENLDQKETTETSAQQLNSESTQYSCSFDSSVKPHTSSTNLQNNFHEVAAESTKDAQLRPLSPAECKLPELDTENRRALDSPNWLDNTPSPFSLDSAYYCPSEVDAVIYSDESNMPDTKDSSCTQTGDLPQQSLDFTEDVPKTISQDDPSLDASSSSMFFESVGYSKNYPPCVPLPQLSPPSIPVSSVASPTQSLVLQSSQHHTAPTQPVSPTSTEILASDTSDTNVFPTDLVLESPPSIPDLPSPLSLPELSPHSVNFEEEVEWGGVPSNVKPAEISPLGSWQGISERREDLLDDSFESELTEANTQDRQFVSRAQYLRLKKLMGEAVQDLVEEEDEDEGYGAAEPLCRQSLSLVYSTIEENYPEGTLQLLSDFLHPRFYPPPDITAHLLRGILLDPQSPDFLSAEAYNLLMQIQKYHPADISTVSWDWDLLTSAMEQKACTKKLRKEVLLMLLKYVLQILEDDFHCKLPMQRLHLSIAKATLSCDKKFTQVRDLINWLLDAAKQSIRNSRNDEKPKSERDDCLKMVLILQRMLVLALEVDRTPACSSNKLSQELCHALNCTAPSRELRLLLLGTLESRLLRCKLLELLLDQSCPDKRPLPMSLKLLLHFLQSSTPFPDPSDGLERWKKWDELVQLLWMLLLSYEEVIKGHLRCSVTERSTYSRAPMWTVNDEVTKTEVQRAAETFLSRALDDLGQALPTQVQESLSQLQEHVLDTCRH
ncbi:SUMO-interacting motif-containing protein 1 [Chanos chanos]|uniref:SUMO-interacting motif-containing protein 1 n=1 Tax=Chanos chanos TaxID=29144 RepID=A0A6J2W3D7_CHACN|nr:SUMO-interacting motif-containing protein 1 [Chanos chanos]